MASSASILWEIGQKKAKKLEYETRKATVNGIKNAVPNVANGYVEYANGKIDSLTEALRCGMSSMNARTNLCEAVSGAKEKYPDAANSPDANLDGTMDHLQAEINACNTKISSLETEISNLNVAYDRAVYEEWCALQEELKRAAEKAKEVVGLE